MSRRSIWGAVKVFGRGVGSHARCREPLIAKPSREGRMSSEDGETEEPDDDLDDDGWEADPDDDA
jgi:hypothetical protein